MNTSIAVDIDYWNRGNKEPEIKLWCAVLEQAMADLEKYPADHKNNPAEWFNSPSMEPGSYLWICELLNINPVLALSRGEYVQAV